MLRNEYMLYNKNLDITISVMMSLHCDCLIRKRHNRFNLFTFKNVSKCIPYILVIASFVLISYGEFVELLDNHCLPFIYRIYLNY